MSKLFTDLFTYEDGKQFVISQRYNKFGKPLCINEGCNNITRSRGKNFGGYSKQCPKHYYGRDIKKNHRKDLCENTDGRLGFLCTTTILDICMLDNDHIDQNHNNWESKNLQTLCKCCHSYKSRMYGHITI